MNLTEPFKRRAYERLRLDPMYTSVTVQRIDGLSVQRIEGHAYDISMSGARIELDEPLCVSDPVALCFRLPGENTSVFVSGSVVWLNDEDDDPCARRIAVRFSRFLSDRDRARLVRYLGPKAEPAAA
jgi:hypothetical protein